ncbi:hypothetical protein CSUNSWCD_2222 [Campylobacter showae CSUNSWCD]|uniref:Uncharacterized protein n=1 Tax=Campylobacter showae CSUNSWCD TaxID=1244083 RepID=M5IPR3_9BACT|nr:hypothetical protein CSUNSWCD_2222 [Campylobacter showae CSUNSWCD]
MKFDAFPVVKIHSFLRLVYHKQKAKFKEPDLRLRRRGAQNAANIRQNIRKFSQNAVKFE